jgi:hypothetical protein
MLDRLRSEDHHLYKHKKVSNADNSAQLSGKFKTGLTLLATLHLLSKTLNFSTKMINWLALAMLFSWVWEWEVTSLVKTS